MWPWGHLAVGYLLYSFRLDRRFERAPAGAAVIILAFGTQFPDLVDKPLAWHLGVIPNGRSLTHSLIVATILVAGVYIVTTRWGQRELGIAFSIGYLSHLAADSVDALLAREYGDLAFLAWPLVPALEYSGPQSIARRFTALYAELLAGSLPRLLLVEFVLTAAALGLWASHGFPGLDTLVPDRRSPPDGR